MNPICLTLTSILAALVLWIAWLTGKPISKPLIDQRSEQALTSLLPPDNEQGNSTVTYTSFSPMVNDLLADIHSAQHHIHIQFFKFETDYIAQRIGNALTEKAAQGVEVRMMYDDIVNLRNKW